MDELGGGTADRVTVDGSPESTPARAVQRHEDQLEASRQRGTPFEVLAVFLKLGLTSFGGPIAHLSYMQAEIVERRKCSSRSLLIWASC